MEKIKVNICSIGDPTDPKTWSGTPFNLYSHLKEINSVADAFNSTVNLNKYENKLIDFLSKKYYGNSVDLGRGKFYRYLNANKAKSLTKTSKSNLTLHTGSLDLPFFQLPKTQKHFLFCDSTWHLWSKNSTAMEGYSEKLLSDAGELERKAYHQIEHIFPISNYVKNDLVEYYNIQPDKITVVGTGRGVIKPFFGEKNYSNGKILFAAKGRFEDKGGPLVLKAFEIALKTNPTLGLTIVGQNDYSEKINLPGVKTLGFLDIKELQAIFDESSVFVMPAINEPWGLVYLEALACKMPIIGLNKNSFPEISGYGKYGFGLENASPEALAQLLIKVCAEPESARKMGTEGQQFCLENYSWQNTVMRIIQKIETLQ